MFRGRGAHGAGETASGATATASGATDAPQTEEVIGAFRYKGADVRNMSDAQVRAVCSERAKFILRERGAWLEGLRDAVSSPSRSTATVTILWRR